MTDRRVLFSADGVTLVEADDTRRQIGADELLAIIEDYEEREKSFDLRWKADMRAIKRWQAAHPGKENIWPDHTDLVVWLLEQLDLAEDNVGLISPRRVRDLFFGKKSQ